MKIYWATRLRGFLKQLSGHLNDVEFISKEGYYEINSPLRKIKSKVIRSRFFNKIGLFQVVTAKDIDCDCYGSFNRFLEADKPYFIYLENPTALYHYTLGRISSKKGKQRFLHCLNDPNLRYIVCMSNACKDTFEKVNVELPPHIKMQTIYPLVSENTNISSDIILQKSNNNYLECLFCVQGIRFVSKGGLEVLTAFERLQDRGEKIRLRIITKISDLDKKTLQRIKSIKNISLDDFQYSYEELEKIYANTNVLIQPSSDDSFGMTVLEAMKGGCAIISSKIYAFPEMVTEGVNGFLIEPKYWFFDKDNIPNPKVWNYRKKTIYSRRESEMLIDHIIEKLSTLCRDRELLQIMSLNSLEKANTKFGEQKICQQWEDVWLTLKY